MDWSLIGTIALFIGVPFSFFVAASWFQLKKTKNIATHAVEELAKLLDNLAFNDVSAEAKKHLEAIDRHGAALKEGFIENKLRQHEHWFQKIIDQHVEKLRSVPINKSIDQKDCKTQSDDLVNLILSIGLIGRPQSDYFFNVLRKEIHPLVWVFALERLSIIEAEEFITQEDQVASIAKTWRHSDDGIKKSPLVFDYIVEFFEHYLDAACDDPRHKRAHSLILKEVEEILETCEKLQAEISDDLGDEFDPALKYLNQKIIDHRQMNIKLK